MGDFMTWLLEPATAATLGEIALAGMVTTAVCRGAMAIHRRAKVISAGERSDG